MGTYTSNYNLFMPTVGETGWGELVNGNFTTIDTTMAGLNTRLTAVENEVNGALSCTSVTTSGKITGNGGIAGTTGTFSGAVTGTTVNGATITATKFNGATINSSGDYSGRNGTFSGTIQGAKIKQTGVTTVASSASSTPAKTAYELVCILPPAMHKYTGSYIVRNTHPSEAITITVLKTLGSAASSHSIAAGSNLTISLSNNQCLYLGASSNSTWNNIAFGTLTLS